MLVLSLLGCGLFGGDDTGDSLPLCSITASFSGAISGTIDHEGDCQGSASEGFTGGTFYDDVLLVGVKVSDSVAFSPGSTADAVDAYITVEHRAIGGPGYYPGLGGCYADVTAIEEHEWWAGTETFVRGRAWCDQPLVATGEDEDAFVEGDIDFYFQLFEL